MSWHGSQDHVKKVEVHAKKVEVVMMSKGDDDHDDEDDQNKL